ncbi:MAG: hypothetical protein ACNI27_03230 [Desulfovibrio sp.]
MTVQKKWLLFSVLLMLGMVFFPYKEFRIERIRAMGEAPTRGVVIGLFKGKEGEVSTLQYEYRDGSGITRTAESPVSDEVWSQYKRLDSITVFYAKARPDICRIRGQIESPTVKIIARFSRSGSE